MSRHVSVRAFERLLEPFAGLGDDDDSEFHDIDSSDESQMRHLIRSHIVPEFNSGSSDEKFADKISLSFFLSTEASLVNIERPLDAILASELNTPNPKDFYIWLWEELFPRETYQLADAQVFHASADGTLYRGTAPVRTPSGFTEQAAPPDRGGE